jgi:hypothetical protein
MRIVILCEGKSEVALGGALKPFLDEHCETMGQPKVRLEIKPFEGTPNCRELKSRLERHASDPEVLGVIGLVDVYPLFKSAGAAKAFLNGCVKDSPSAGKFHAHAAQMELEAWLLPFWTEIARRLNVQARPPGAAPEQVNDEKPPSHHLKELYRRAKQKYEKPVDAAKILKRHRIEAAADKCPELRSLLDTLTRLCNVTESANPRVRETDPGGAGTGQHRTT